MVRVVVLRAESFPFHTKHGKGQNDHYIVILKGGGRKGLCLAHPRMMQPSGFSLF